MTLIRTILGGGGGTIRLLALAALLALLAAAALSLAPAAAEGDPNEFELVLSLDEDSDNIVPAGSEFTVNAALRFPWQLPIAPPEGLPSYTPYALNVPGASVAVSNLRISGDLEWDSAGRRRLDLAAQTPIEATRLPVQGNANQTAVKAFDGRTLVARSSRPNELQLYIYDSYTLAHAATIAAPAGTYSGAQHQNRAFGASVGWNPLGNYFGSWYGKAIDVWHETADRAWLFVGSWGDNVASRAWMGRLLRYRLDWDDDGVEVTSMGWLTPPLTEVDNRHGTGHAHYGSAVSFSRDGGTLAVSAPRMNGMGAVYVYSRPDGAGEDWGDITYADGVKVTVGAVPSWGASATNMPFLPGTAYDASNPRSCDSWCSMVWSSFSTDSYDGVDLGSMRVSLSADGRVLVVGAGEKEYAVDTPGGGFVAGNRRDNAGEAFVWVAPEGGWRNAPRADRDASGNAKTLIAAKTDATSFRRATHYSPGPLRRVTEPAAVLAAGTWPNVGESYFGMDAVVSPDGATAAVANADGNPARGAVFIFQRDSAGDWASVNGGYLAPSATLSGLTNPHQMPPYFGLDGSELLIGQPLYSSSRGAVLVYTQPADGTWVNAAASTARVLREPGTWSDDNQRFGYMTPELSGLRMAIGTQAQHREYLTSPVIRGCSLSTVAGETTASCPLTLPGSTITIPTGTPDGPFTISGSVALQLGGGDPVTLRDTLEVTVGKVDELARLEFDFATDTSTGQPHSAVVGPGGRTTLLLKLLNENGKASAKGAAASVLVTTTRGALSARLGAASGEACDADGGRACRIANPATALTAGNSDKIRLTVTHPGAAKAGVAQLRAIVVGAGGETFESESIAVTFSGAPTALAIAQPPTALLAYAPTESADQRNAATLVVSASDAGGNKATVPSSRYSAKLTDPDGKTVTSQQAAVTWPLREGGAADGALALSGGNPQARVTILAGAAAPLAAGEYTLELSAGSGAGRLSAAQTLVVTGGAAAVALSADPVGDLEEGDSVTLTAVVSDASGAPVPDGTPVTFSEQSTGANVALVLVSQSEQRTRNGQASATLRAVGVGGAYVTAEADDVSDLRSITVAPPPPPSLAEAIADLAIGGFATWTIARTTTAAELYDALEGAAWISKWDGAEWLSYGETDGLLNSGSIDFSVVRGDVLWLSGG